MNVPGSVEVLEIRFDSLITDKRLLVYYVYQNTTSAKQKTMKFLSNIEKDFYSQNGFIKLKNLLSADEIEEVSNAYSDLFKVDYFCPFLVCLDDYLNKKFVFVFNQRKEKENANMSAIWKGGWQEKFTNDIDMGSAHVQSIHNLQVRLHM